MKRLSLLICVVLLIGLNNIGLTNSSFVDTEVSAGNTFTAGCWAAPFKPTLLSPANGYVAKIGSAWLSDPYMDWSDSWVCPGKTVSYQYESYSDSGLTTLVYRSDPLLTDSRIPASGTPDGTYYWRVRAYDGGQWGDWSDVWLLTVDQHAPDTFIDSGPTGTVSVSTASFAFHGTDTNDTFECKLDSSAWSACTSPKDYSGLVDGAHTFSVRATDLAGNTDLTPATRAWTISATPPAAALGDVVINELMWMGSTLQSHDEWIELRNMRNYSINLSGWKVENAGSGGSAVTLSGTVGPNTYYLIARYQTNFSNAAIRNTITADETFGNLSLADGGEQLTLKSGDSTIIDQTPVGVWVQGVNGTEKKSMERNDTPGNGTIPGNWLTCLDLACTSISYWDDGVVGNYGTPKDANKSGNDPSSPDYKPEPELNLSKDDKNIYLGVKNIDGYTKLSYELTYDTDSSPQGVVGSVDLTAGQSEYQKDVLLGTCSTGGTCVYQSGVKNVHLKITLTNSSGTDLVLEKTL